MSILQLPLFDKESITRCNLTKPLKGIHLLTDGELEVMSEINTGVVPPFTMSEPILI